MEAMEAAEEDALERRNGSGADLKGTVRPLADSISVEAAERASKQVRDAITQQQRQLEEFQRFSEENKSLSELVLELPDAVSHQIMVPFGKAAFFPGRLKHSNEFLVLLGENHYAERSAKQTVKILDRRSKFLEEKIASTKARIADLEAESAFVTNTAEEAKAGLVEIREEYSGSGQLQRNQASTSKITAAAATRETDSVSQDGGGSDFEPSTSSRESVNADEEREFHLLMARLSELELAEAAAGEDNEDSEEEVEDESQTGYFEPLKTDPRKKEVSWNENDLVEEDYDSEETEDGDSQLSNSDDEDGHVEDSQTDSEEEMKTEDEDEDDNQSWRHGDKGKQEALKGKPLSRFAREAYAKKGSLDSQPVLQKVTFQPGNPTHKKPPTAANHEVRSNALEQPEAMRGYNDLQKDLRQWRREGMNQKERRADEVKNVGSSLKDSSRVPSTGAAGQLKAFTGIVTERRPAEPAIPNEQQSKVEEAAQQARPMSKFKMRQVQAGRK